ncbi:pleckstrin homology domain-containing family S member 1-like [Astyanax mexicanus]|uniref:pleckstrin homology domain-containing family S member 1-like n=1 Tax=Astyanax mexicanus TaxID=7994 RepID=UPI0020CB4451|nr:pleckstrin homology domain-containing family S member 1-like [Astyanax mexicanus]XP_049320571.1 pleckstrin homology domain-containing family S member 1-like [Astyanax mexicanus]
MASREEELCSGYLYKSPPATLFKSQKSWKRRFFILKNIKTFCQLEYFESEEKTKSELLGAVDLSQVSLMLLRPETHTMWQWVHEHFKCSAASVLFMKVADRDYFFIGENSWEVERWFHALFNALNSRPHRLLDPKDSGGIRDISAPPESEHTDHRAEWRLDANKISKTVHCVRTSKRVK